MTAPARIVDVYTLPRPDRQRPITMQRAAELFPEPAQQIQWLRAIAFLRTRTTYGWLFDRLPDDQEPPQ
jgi:hypothetical protein